MFFYILFLESESYYFVETSQESFHDLISDLKCEFEVFHKMDDCKGSALLTATYYYKKDGKDYEIGYISLVRECDFEGCIP